MENGRCNLHGGKQPRGIASPNFKHGLYSRHLHVPESLKAQYERLRADPTVLAGRADLALAYCMLELSLAAVGDVPDAGESVEREDLEKTESVGEWLERISRMQHREVAKLVALKGAVPIEYVQELVEGMLQDVQDVGLPEPYREQLLAKWAGRTGTAGRPGGPDKAPAIPAQG